MMTHDPARPDLSAQRAVLATARAVLAADPEIAHDAAGTGSCPECTTICAIQLAVALVATRAGDTAFASEQTLRWILAEIDSAQAEIDAAPN